MTRLKERMCMYCSSFKPDVGFKFVSHLKSMTRRGMCTTCQDKRKIPHSTLIEMAAQDKLERNKK